MTPNQRVCVMSRLIPAAVLLIACAAGDDWKPSKPGEIFRYTSVGTARPFDSIVLGRPWTSAAKYGGRAGDTLNSLPRGVFSGADRIRVRRDTAGLVTALEFDYSTRRDIASIHRDYEGSLGAPAESAVDTISGQVRRVSVWRDAETEFRIIQFVTPRSDRIAATAVLADRLKTAGNLTRP